MHRTYKNATVVLLLANMLLLVGGIAPGAPDYFNIGLSDDCCDKERGDDHANDADCSSSACSCISCMTLGFSQASTLPATPAPGTAGNATDCTLNATEYVRSIEYPPNA